MNTFLFKKHNAITPKTHKASKIHQYRQGLLPTTGFLLAWTFLNTLLNLNYPGWESDLPAALLPSFEIWALLLILCAAVWRGMPFHRAIYVSLTGLCLFLRLFRIGDVLMPMYFNRDFNLYMDVQYIPDLMHLLYHTVSRQMFFGYAVLAIGMLIVVILGIWNAFKYIHRYFEVSRHRRIFLGMTTALAGLLLFVHPGGSGKSTGLWPNTIFPRVVEEVEFIWRLREYKKQGHFAIQDVINKSQQFPVSLDKLSGADVYILFVESYGHTVFADSRHFSLIRPVLESFEKTLSTHGFGVYSHFMKSATYGGASWLAHGTLASGVRTYDQTRFNLLLNSDVKTLARYFNDAGYRTLSIMPGTTMPWPEGEFFGYQQHYYASDFKYKGPQYGWSTMPDQFVLDYIFRQEIQRRKQPLFIEYVLISSHAPFHSQPPYLEDWSQIGDGSIFQERQPVTFPIVWPDLSNATKAYMTSLIYEMRVLESYLAQYIEDDALIIILGDHQPNVQITGKNSLWSVPVHVISRNPEFLEAFVKRGYRPGLIPQQPLPHPGMETFLYDFLEDFGTLSPTLKMK